MNLIFMEYGLVLLKTRGLFIKLPSIECVSILLKFKGSFIKLALTKSEVVFAKLLYMDFFG